MNNLPRIDNPPPFNFIKENDAQKGFLYITGITALTSFAVIKLKPSSTCAVVIISGLAFFIFCQVKNLFDKYDGWVITSKEQQAASLTIPDRFLNDSELSKNICMKDNCTIIACPVRSPDGNLYDYLNILYDLKHNKLAKRYSFKEEDLVISVELYKRIQARVKLLMEEENAKC